MEKLTRRRLLTATGIGIGMAAINGIGRPALLHADGNSPVTPDATPTAKPTATRTMEPTVTPTASPEALKPSPRELRATRRSEAPVTHKIELNKGDAYLVWGSEIIVKGISYKNAVWGVLAHDEIGTLPQNAPDGVTFTVPANTTVTEKRIPALGKTVEQQHEVLRAAIENKATELLHPNGTLGSVKLVEFKVTQRSLEDPINMDLVTDYYWFR